MILLTWDWGVAATVAMILITMAMMIIIPRRIDKRSQLQARNQGRKMQVLRTVNIKKNSESVREMTENEELNLK